MNEARAAQLIAQRTAALAPRPAPRSNADAMNDARRAAARRACEKLIARVTDHATREALAALLELTEG